MEFSNQDSGCATGDTCPEDCTFDSCSSERHFYTRSENPPFESFTLSAQRGSSPAGETRWVTMSGSDSTLDRHFDLTAQAHVFFPDCTPDCPEPAPFEVDVFVPPCGGPVGLAVDPTWSETPLPAYFGSPWGGGVCVVQVVTGVGPDCGEDADGDGLTFCQEATQGTSDATWDTDGDAISDFIESIYYPARVSMFCGGVCDFPAPTHRDLYVEMDYMGADHLPDEGSLLYALAAFEAESTQNLDGVPGIRLHLDAGPAIPAFDLGGGEAVSHDDNLGTATSGCSSYDWTEFDDLKADHFGQNAGQADRPTVFHYMIWAHSQPTPCGTASGLSRNDGSSLASFREGASDFIVTLGGWSQHGSSLQRLGTFLHELGHNIGFVHGGVDHASWKPNYLSVMNYFFQVHGIPPRDVGTGSASGLNVYGFSNEEMASLNEASLDEDAGIGGTTASAFKTKWWCTYDTDNRLSDSNAAEPTNWNCDATTGGTVAKDINGSGGTCTSSVTTGCDVLVGARDWDDVAFGGGSIGGASGSQSSPVATTSVIQELTYEMQSILDSIELNLGQA